MPRASQYLLEGYTYHLTHRCHDRQFLLRFSRDRDVYREWLREGVHRHRVSLYGFCVTHNHVHVIVHADRTAAVSDLMHLAAGSTAKRYNLRKGHLGSMWEHPYQCTVIQDGRHLFNCLCYVDLNMVRAGAVSHPRQWRWCGYDELTGRRKRYCLLDMDRLLGAVGAHNANSFREMYEEAIRQRLASGGCSREPHWTESLAVGGREFVACVQGKYSDRQVFDVSALPGDSSGGWSVREAGTPYGVFVGAQNGR